MSDKILHVVHCIDTEGPLNETLNATFERVKSIFSIDIEPSVENLKKLQNKKLPLNGLEAAVATCIAPEFLKYNKNWNDIDEMLEELLSVNFRNKTPDDFGGGWKYSWHCMDHIGLNANPRHKDYGYGNIFRHYRNKIKERSDFGDEINWHFHPLSLTRQPLHAATSYVNNYTDLHQIISRRIIDENWFPVVNRPGFHAERPDSHAFLEQWIPFDYANQYTIDDENQPDASDGRFGDWRRAPASWRGYHPSHDDYQIEGRCKRKIFRCMNIGTRLRVLTEAHLWEAFAEANEQGSAIVAFADHDYRDIRPDVLKVQEMLANVRKEYPYVKIKYSGAQEAARQLSEKPQACIPELALELIGNKLFVTLIAGQIFGSQPYLAIKTKEQNFYHDNFDVVDPNIKWSYIFDEYTLDLNVLDQVGIGTAGRYGGYTVVKLDLKNS
jgi:hypothetical protein